MSKSIEFDTENTDYVIVRCRTHEDMVKIRRALHDADANSADVVIRGDQDNYFGLLNLRAHREAVARVFHNIMDVSKASARKLEKND